ncbi:hypothetical protein B0A48_12536 [Cryoendolithus antarcticus]|uniref:Uncharacterized protein n=1 Tax=Cryoendolithus antarcticus TaxID=1507870 RepID=A0A1V8ST32_9PEZI|nr:hypothetical protein B0A48_12536 [Cryoendolithus antarcticus]
MDTTLVAQFDLLANSGTGDNDACKCTATMHGVDFHWRNLGAWLKATWGASDEYEYLDGLIYTYGTVTPNLEFAGRAQEIAKTLRGVPWEQVEKVLHSLRNSFMRSDLQWGRDLN